ncbi:adenosylcobinamide-GDP ribazoletransferase [Psychrobacillus sp. INOP01]|uniref:adenosylcobinamide-GDP ribazoletransferase n=1 Tax=Psychrobacillus sp. INOP01 TaxID=2829187 RepID=UPI001BABDAD8|nr:adenosylcobinamide-GDP ribazoletransferase [Psychrobacillus sp. INOP01]QUG40463.1 adenosylcobinamide-GDP ribazoletransferase [Psychrobacillus sp. INOP01]
MSSILLALQFFSVIPVNKNLPMERRSITGMYCVFPWIGAGIGAIACLMLYFEWSSLMTGFSIVFLGVVLSGGLHMDGFIDTSDAFFSYKDRLKRFEILEDPRVGAFGVMAVVFLVIGKVIIISEVLTTESFHWIFVLLIPFFSRVTLGLLFSLTNTAKTSGLAYYFKQRMNANIVIITTACHFFIGLGILGWMTNWMVTVTVAVVIFAFICLFRSWVLKNFGGVNGDLLGASVEISEVILWLTLLVLLS